MPMNGYSIGRDVTLDLVTPQGIFRPSIITGFQAKQEVTDIKVKRLDGVIDPLYLPDGWTGKFDFERQNSVLDDYFALLEANYYSGLNIAGISITETIREVAGNVTQYRFINVMLKLEDAGEWKGDATVKQAISWMAARRLKIS